MPTVSVIYFSGSGHTTKLAEAVNQGAASVAGVKTQLIAISGDDIVEGRYKNDAVFAKLDASDAIILAAPLTWAARRRSSRAFADATGRQVVSPARGRIKSRRASPSR
jgi:NAD(P)H dehydrogenase (quinone)